MNQKTIPPEQRPILLVNTEQLLKQALSEIHQFKYIAVDVEANSFKTFREDVCLIQIGTIQKIYLFDMLKLNDITGIKAVLEDTSIEKIFHDLRYDFKLLKNKLGIFPRQIFDTYHASKVLQNFKTRKHSLDHLISKYFEYEPSSKNYGISDWAQRPLPADMINYAAHDVRYLIEIRDRLVQAAHSEAELKENFEYWEDYNEAEKRYNPDHFVSLPGAHDLSPEQLRVLKELYNWRLEEAKQSNRALFIILSKDQLVELAKATSNIKTVNDVKELIGKGTKPANRYSSQVFQVIKQAKQMEPINKRNIHNRKKYLPVEKKNESSQSDARQYSTPKQHKRKGALYALRNTLAHEYKRRRDFIFPEEVITKLSQINPQTVADLPTTKGFGSWRIKNYGKQIIEAIQTANDAYKCYICYEEMCEAEILANCPYCDVRFHIHCIEDYLEDNTVCPSCSNSILASHIKK